MNRAEQKSFNQAKKEGWNSVSSGKPDRLDWRIENGRIVVIHREVKGIGDALHDEQPLYLTLLCLSGQDVEVWYEWGEGGFYKRWNETEEFKSIKNRILGTT